MQKSVYEGNLTESKLQKLKGEILRIIVTEEDAVCIYCMDSIKFARKEQIGKSVETGHVI